MSVNPLKQYFRRPAIFIKLPSNYEYYNKSIVERTDNDELPVYPMTAIDEITIRTPDALFSGQAVIDVIQSCIPNIKNAWEINNIDLESIFIAIKIASYGENMDVESHCPACNEDSSYTINLTNILASKSNVDYEKTLKAGDLEIKFKPLTFKENNKISLAQYELEKILVMLQDFEESEEKKSQIKQNVSKLNKLYSEIVSESIEWIRTPETTVKDKNFILEFVENCDKNTNESIKNFSLKLKAESDLKPLQIKCIKCEHNYSQKLTMNMSDFFA